MNHALRCLERIGEPFVRSRKKRSQNGAERVGLGLGLFIAKTLLQRSGADLEIANIDQRGQHGAVASVVWPRVAIDLASNVVSGGAEGSIDAHTDLHPVES